jgi:hypothetical protein
MPPAAAARAPQVALVAVVRSFAADVDRLARAARAGDPDAAVAAGRAASALAPKLSVASADIQTALDEALKHR